MAASGRRPVALSLISVVLAYLCMAPKASVSETLLGKRKTPLSEIAKVAQALRTLNPGAFVDSELRSKRKLNFRMPPTMF